MTDQNLERRELKVVPGEEAGRAGPHHYDCPDWSLHIGSRSWQDFEGMVDSIQLNVERMVIRR